MYLHKQNFLIFGVSRSGFQICKFLLNNGAKCYIYEELSANVIDNSIENLEKMGAISVEKGNVDSVISLIDVVVVSPGVPINHPVLIKLKRAKKRITGELELASKFINSPIIAITGTNGKTTTASLLSNVLDVAKIKNYLCGNIGTPMSAIIDKLDVNAVAVTEVSSFQLETTTELIPHIATVLNVAPDHLDRHYNMENYVFLKKRILKNLRESEYAVLNYDDDIVSEFDEGLTNVVWFSLYEEVENGAYLKDEKLYYNGEFIIEKSELSLRGAHNVSNALACICMAKILKVDNQLIAEGLKTFKGVKHRMEIVYQNDDVTYVNDSKSTNAASSISAIKAINGKKVIILGGRGKNESYDDLFETIKSNDVTHAVLMGESKYEMLNSANKIGYDKVTLTGDFECAVRVAKLVCEKGGTVIFSPACSSFDMFDGYEERGNCFCKIVGDLVDDNETN